MPAPTPRSAVGLLRQAADGIAEAHREPDPITRYPLAYLAALRAAAAVLAACVVHTNKSTGGDQELIQLRPDLSKVEQIRARCRSWRRLRHR